MEVVDLVNTLINELVKYGIKDISMDQYKACFNRYLKFCSSRSEKYYNDSTMEDYIQHLLSIKDSIAFGYYRFNLRVCRMIKSLATSNKIDFTRAKTANSKYPLSEEANQLVEDILFKNCTTTKETSDFRGPIRHLLWYIDSKNIDLEKVDDSIIMEFFVNEVPKTNSGSVSRTRKCIQYVVDYLVENGNSNLKRNYQLIKVKSEAVRMIPAFTDKELKAIIDVIDTNTVIGKRDLAIILLAYVTGLRSCDIAALKLTDIDWRKKCVKVVQSKTRKPIICHLNGMTLNALADYKLNGRPECDIPEMFVSTKAPYKSLKSNLNTIINRYIGKTSVKKIKQRGFHSIRRAFETTLVSKGVPIETASQMLGHSTINEDKPYLTFNREQCSFVALDFTGIPLRSPIYGEGNN